jgi:signal peptidase I
MLGRRVLAWIRLTRRHVLSPFGAPAETSSVDEFVSRMWSYAKFGGVLMCCQTYLLDITMCIGPSMLPTFNSVGDIVLCDKLTPRLRRLRRGDVVACMSPVGVGQHICKRVVGMPGDELDGQHREQDWLDHRVVPPGHVWLEGDNPRNSMDSRNYGPVPFALVQSRVFYKIWPLHEAGPIPARREKASSTLRYSESVRMPFSDRIGSARVQ